VRSLKAKRIVETALKPIGMTYDRRRSTFLSVRLAENYLDGIPEHQKGRFKRSHDCKPAI